MPALFIVVVLSEMNLFPGVLIWTEASISQVRRRLPDFAPAKVLDFGAGPSSALW